MRSIRSLVLLSSIFASSGAFPQSPSTDKSPQIESLLASTYIGGSGHDDTYEPSMAVDSAGNIYLSGFTYSSDLLKGVSGYDGVMDGPCDRFVIKFDPELKTMLAGTYIGGDQHEFGMGIAVDAEDHVYLAGYTNSQETFPASPGGFVSEDTDGLDAFVVMLDSSLKNVLGATRFGGSQHEGERWPRIDLGIGGNGDVYVVGLTKSPDFPIVGGADDSYAGGGANLKGGDLFVARFDAKLTKLKASTFLGGEGDEWRPSLVLDKHDNVVVCGDTMGLSFPTTPGCYDADCESAKHIAADIFITKFSSDLGEVLASTFYGCEREEDALAVRVDDSGAIIVAGYATSGGCPVTAKAAFPKYAGGARDVVIAKFSPDLKNLIAATFIGGDGADTAEDIVLDEEGNVYVAGLTTSSSVPYPSTAPKGTQPKPSGGEDCFLSVLTPDLGTLSASIHLGGSGDDRAQALLLANKSLYICGRTLSDDYPLVGKPLKPKADMGGTELFMSRFPLTFSVFPSTREASR